MIHVAGRPFSLDAMKDLGREEREIIQQMLDSPELFSYPSINELRFEVNIRINMMESAMEMDESQVKFTIFEKARCNPRYWDLTSAGGFLLRSGVRPSEAILDIYRNGNLYAFECATAIIIIYYQAILKSIGHHRFDSYFQNLYLYSWHTDPNLELRYFYLNHFLPGDVVYFTNPDFHPQTPWYRGVNAAVLSDEMFFGHGFGIITAEEMIPYLNSKRFPGSTQSAYLANIITRISPATMYKLFILQGGYHPYRSPKMPVHHNLCSIPSIHHYSF